MSRQTGKVYHEAGGLSKLWCFWHTTAGGQGVGSFLTTRLNRL